MLFVIGVPSSGYLRYLESLHFATLKLFIWIMPFRAKVNYETCHVNTISPEVEYPDRSPYSHYNCLKNMGTWILLAYINLNTRLLATSRCLVPAKTAGPKSNGIQLHHTNNQLHPIVFLLLIIKLSRMIPWFARKVEGRTSFHLSIAAEDSLLNDK